MERVAERILLHPHVDQQPFTRAVGGAVLPDGVSVLTIRAHHRVGGF